jgi:drug/metabolite transporter (DMT)-like permease
VWLRYARNLLLLLAILALRGQLRLMRTARPGIQAMRGVLLGAATMLFFLSISVMPLAEAAGIGFVMPLFMVLLAVPMLKERLDMPRLAAVLVGLAGALHWLLFALLGVFATAGHLALIRAYEHAPVGVLAPLHYSVLFWMMLLGYLVFGDFPDHWSLAGMAIIVASGLYIANRQRYIVRKED